MKSEKGSTDRRVTGGFPVLVMAVFLLSFPFGESVVEAQTLTTGDPMELYLRWVVDDREVEGLPSFTLRPVSLSAYRSGGVLPEAHPWSRHSWFETLTDSGQQVSSLSVYSPQWVLSHNTALPSGQNDGALWQGRGMNYAVTAGIGYQYGPVQAVFRPVYVYSENREFELSNDPQHEGLSPYAMALTNSDLPQRFGENSFSRFDPGDSYIQAVLNGWAGGLSNERIWTGPALHNPLMFSNNAPGFLHAFVGTEKPKPVKLLDGHIEARWFWGGVRESDYFDEDPSNNLRYLTGLVFSYSPRFVPGLHIGFTRVAYAYYPDNGPGLPELMMAFRPSPAYREARRFDAEEAWFAKGSVFARWAFPESGFEAYLEWGRNDYQRIARDLIMEPELNRAYVLGLIKRFSIDPERRIIFNLEITNLENSSVSSEYREESTIWYTNDVIRQGFTHRGQVLGAGIGPGSSTQYLGVTYYDSWGLAGLYGSRIVHHNDRLYRHRDYYHSTLPRPWMDIRWIPEVEMRYGFRGLVFLPWNLELQAELHVGTIENRHNNFDRTDGGFGDDIHFDEKNSRMVFTVRYHLPGWRR